MKVFSRVVPLGALVVVALPLAACSTDGFKEAVGLSKSAPDETQVSTSQPLAMPPDYALRPPVERVEPVEAPTPTPATAAATQTASLQTAPSPVPSPTPGGATPQAGANGQTANTGQDNSNPYGISKTNPDGTPKTAKQIQEEARQIKIAREKAKNPNYGTWKNLLGVIWD